MNVRAALFAAALAAASVSVAVAAGPRARGDIRPATIADLPPDAAAAVRERSAQPPVGAAPPGSAQVVVIDPATGRILDAPLPPPGTPDYLEPTPDKRVDMSLRMYPNGFLYVDTSGYQYDSTATIDADGNVHVQCDEPGHDHAAGGHEP